MYKILVTGKMIQKFSDLKYGFGYTDNFIAWKLLI